MRLRQKAVDLHGIRSVNRGDFHSGKSGLWPFDGFPLFLAVDALCGRGIFFGGSGKG
jgi:hypothetical protein